MEPLLTAKDVSKLFKCSLPLVYKMAERGQLRSVRWECPSSNGKRNKTVVRFKKIDVLRFVEANYE